MSKQLKPYRYPLWLNILRFLTGQPLIKFKAFPPAEENKPQEQKMLPPKRDTSTSGPPPGCGDIFDRNGQANAALVREAMSQVKQMQEILGQNVPSEAPKTNDILHLSYRPKAIYVPSKTSAPNTHDIIKLDGDALFSQDGSLVLAPRINSDDRITYLSEDIRKLEQPKSTRELTPPDPLALLFQESITEAEKARLAKEKADEEYCKSEEFKREFKKAIDGLIKDSQILDESSLIYAFNLKKVVATKVIAWLNENKVEARLVPPPSIGVVANRKQFIKLMQKTTGR
jgi:hypothetical protein